MIEIKKFEFNPFGEATYLVWDTPSLDAMVIDPGMANTRERDEFDEFVRARHLHLTQMVNTHLHLDHTFGNDWLRERYALMTQANEGDASLGARRAEQARMFGMHSPAITPLTVERNLSDGDVVKVGDASFTVLQVPGHSPGSIALYDAAAGIVFTGDALFKGSIGRTDLTGGDYATLLHSIRTKLLTLPPATVVYPGHGPSTTIGEEKVHNPFLR